jgi:TRIAD3 protein (E3 ubiquitin-protein ligase RNF216)
VCGCCFTEEVWVSAGIAVSRRSQLTTQEELVQCQEGHLFCKDCVTQHAQTKLGDQSFVSEVHVHSVAIGPR